MAFWRRNKRRKHKAALALAERELPQVDPWVAAAVAENLPLGLPYTKWIGPGNQSQEALARKERMYGEETAGLYLACDLCAFVVHSADANILNWAMRDHMYRNHPTQGRSHLG